MHDHESTSATPSRRLRRWLGGGLLALGLGLVAVGCEPPFPIDGNDPADPIEIGATGPAGPPGPVGPAGPSGILSTVGFVGPVATIQPNSGVYVWAGPPGQVTTDAAHLRVTASVSAGMGLTAGATLSTADVGVCFQSAAGGVLTNFVGSNFTQHYFTSDRASYAADATKVFPVGTFNVGMCVRNNGSKVIGNNNFASGWAMVTA